MQVEIFSAFSPKVLAQVFGARGLEFLRRSFGQGPLNFGGLRWPRSVGRRV